MDIAKNARLVTKTTSLSRNDVLLACLKSAHVNSHWIPMHVNSRWVPA